MRFYIGTRLSGAELAQTYARELTAAGWRQTFDWTAYLGQPQLDAAALAQAELAGVAQADVVVLLLPGGRGTHVELGAAAALGKRVYLCADSPAAFAQEQAVVFYALPQAVRLAGTPAENIRRILALSGSPARPSSPSGACGHIPPG